VNNDDTPENVHRAKLLDLRAIPPMTDDIPVRTDVFIHDLEPDTLEALRQCAERGMTPRLDFGGDDGSIAIIRFTRPRAGEASLMVGVEFHAENNEVVGKIYDAKSLLKHATNPRDTHLDGSVRATVSRLLLELAAKVAGDPSF
jgi:hypothetical protein